MRLVRLAVILAVFVVVCGCEFDDGVSQEVRDQADYAIGANDPYSCYHLKKEAEINWCLSKFSDGTNSTAGCKLILNSSYSNNCVSNIALTTGDWSKCGDMLSYAENAKCRVLVAWSNVMRESEGGEAGEETEGPSTTLPAGAIQVDGSAAFTQETDKALKLLEGTKEYSEIAQNVGRVKESPKSGMNVYSDVPTFEVGQTTWQGGTVWYAGTIAHDSYHSKLYNDAKAANGGQEPDASAWTGAAAEQKCLQYQIKVLREMGGDASTIEYLEGLAKNPTYQNVPYDSRNW
ncbi:MAG: hypothetical protein PHG85_07110 [Candidatus Altiarchaeota archaeon]|nr:hypothetical protein [Candidatus Altiarchaeota archaeon]